MKTITPDRAIRCRYLNRHDNQCTGQAVDEQGEILLCLRHLGLALELINNRAATSTLALQ